MKYFTNAALIASLLAFSTTVSAADKKKKPEPAPAPAASSAAPAPEAAGAERVNVDNIKEKYWARGDENEIGVVQNRTYSKAGKWELGVFGGMLVSDPFISVKSLGGSFGYHFSEYFTLHAIGWKAFPELASSFTEYQNSVEGVGGLPASPYVNFPRAYYGLEAVGSFLYGKLSLLGKKIIYYDMHFLGGLGATNTDNGTYFTPSVGIGQKIYLSKWASLRFDYRLMRYNEVIKETIVPSRLGQEIGSRPNWTNSITIGIDFLFGREAKEPPTGDLK